MIWKHTCLGLFDSKNKFTQHFPFFYIEKFIQKMYYRMLSCTVILKVLRSRGLLDCTLVKQKAQLLKMCRNRQSIAVKEVNMCLERNKKCTIFTHEVPKHLLNLSLPLSHSTTPQCSSSFNNGSDSSISQISLQFILQVLHYNINSAFLTIQNLKITNYIK